MDSRTDDAQVIAALLATLDAPRVLALGTGDGSVLVQLAAALPAEGALFAFEPDPQRAATVRDRLAQAGAADRVHVMIGSPARLLHKVAGPFDVILAAGSTLDLEAARGRLRELLRPGGMLVEGSPSG